MKNVQLPISLFFLFITLPAAFAFENNTAEQTKINIEHKALTTPSVRRYANIKLIKEFPAAKLGHWTNQYAMDELAAFGKVKKAQHHVNISFFDIATYQGNLTDILMGFNNTEHKNMLQSMLSIKERKNNSQTDRRQYIEYKNFLTEAKGKPIFWHGLNVIASYSTLAKLLTDKNVQKIQLLAPNAAARFDYVVSNDKLIKQPLKMMDKGPSPSGINDKHFIYTQNESADNDLSPVQPHDDNLTSSISCGPGVPNENNCPPDVLWVPDFENTTTMLWSLTQGSADIPDIINESTQWVVGESRVQFSFNHTNLQAFTNSALPHCDPQISGEQALCGAGSQENVAYVPDSAFETEVILPNPECWGRTGIASVDPLFGCFAPTTMYSNYTDEVEYHDTTFFDDDEIFNAAIGAAFGENLDTSKYFNATVRYAAKNEKLNNFVGKFVNYNAQIGHKAIPCLLSYQWCVFAVDTTTVARNQLFWN